MELESEKAVASIPSPAAGIVTKIHVNEGDEIKVGQVIFSLSEDGVSAGKSKVANGEAGSPREERLSPEVISDEINVHAVAEPEAEAVRQVPPTGFPPPASPSIRKMAAKLGLDLSRVRGSERGGRIIFSDVRTYIERLQQIAFRPGVVTPEQRETRRPTPPLVDFSKWGPIHREKMTNLRRTISHHMSDAWTSIPHITQFDEADITELMKLRKKHAAAYEKKDAHLTLTSFVLKAITVVLKKYPKFNSSLDESTEEIIYKDYCHLGVAVDTEQGLIVPVIRNADKKSLLEISIELDKLAERARQRKLSLEEMQGGTFTISNQGGIGGGHFTPIINRPEVAILGLGRGGWRPVVRNGKMEKRVVLPLVLSYDHRVVDGADAARFVTELVAVVGQFKDNDVALRLGTRKGKK
jgi:pyruvate dehydrogenase E2 component (dihydrolipoamide acetyltransferase)